MASQETSAKTSTSEKIKGFFNKAASGEPVSKVRNKKVAEEFWPAALDKESDKAACILRSFFIDGYVVPYRTLNRVPNEVSPTYQYPGRSSNIFGTFDSLSIL